MRGIVNLQRGHSSQVENMQTEAFCRIHASKLNSKHKFPLTRMSVMWELEVSLCIPGHLPSRYRLGIELHLLGLVWLAGIMGLVLIRIVSRKTGVLSGTFHYSA